METHNETPADLTQLIRYTLTIDNLLDDAAAGRAREALMVLGLIVDRVDPGTPAEAEVVALSADAPGTEAMRTSLQEAGFALRNIDRNLGS